MDQMEYKVWEGAMGPITDARSVLYFDLAGACTGTCTYKSSLRYK